MNKVNNFLKKSTAGLLALATLAGGIVPGVVFAAEDSVSELEVLLSEENIEITSVDVNLDEISLELTAETATGEDVSVEVEFSPGDSHITIIAFEYNDEGVLEAHEFVIDLGNMENHAGANGENLEFLIQDVETGEIFEYNMDAGILSSRDCVFIGCITLSEIVLGGIRVAIEFVESLLMIGEIIIMEGVIWLSLTASLLTAIPIIGPILGGIFGIFGLFGGGGNAQGFQVVNSDHTHFNVMIDSGMYYIGEGLTLNEAAEVLRAGGNVWTQTAAGARAVANLAGSRLPSLIQNNSLTGRRANMYLDHILPTPRTGGNAYFGTNLRRGLRP